MTANIGIHFIDMLHWIFGPVEKVVLHHSSPECSAGFLQLKGARVRYFLSVNAAHRPSPNDNPMSPYRHLVINGRGFAVEDTVCAVHTLDMLQKSAAVGLTGDYHPLLRNLQG